MSECIRPGSPLCLDDARRIVAKYVREYNELRLHGALGYITPQDKLLGREVQIFAERDRKLAAARQLRSANRRRQNQADERQDEHRDERRNECRDESYTEDARTEDRALLASTPSADPGPEANALGDSTSASASSASSNLLLASCEKRKPETLPLVHHYSLTPTRLNSTSR